MFFLNMSYAHSDLRFYCGGSAIYKIRKYIESEIKRGNYPLPFFIAQNVKCCAPTSYQEFPRRHSGPHPQTTSCSKCPGRCFRMSLPRCRPCCLCRTCLWNQSLHTFWLSYPLRTRRCTGIHHFSPQVLHQNRDTRGSLLVLGDLERRSLRKSPYQNRAWNEQITVLICSI